MLGETERDKRKEGNRDIFFLIGERKHSLELMHWKELKGYFLISNTTFLH